MKRLLLKLFSSKDLIAEIIQREYPKTPHNVDASAWKQVFHKVPAMSAFLARREINLLRSFALKDKSHDYILGQIAEIKIAQAFDVPSESKPVDVDPLPKVPTTSRTSFMRGWMKPNADKGDAKTA